MFVYKGVNGNGDLALLLTVTNPLPFHFHAFMEVPELNLRDCIITQERLGSGTYATVYIG